MPAASGPRTVQAAAARRCRSQKSSAAGEHAGKGRPSRQRRVDPSELPLQAVLAAGVAATRLPTAGRLLAGPFPLRRLDVPEFAGGWDGAVSTELTPFHHASVGILSLGAAGAPGGVPAAALRASIRTSSLLALAIALGCAGVGTVVAVRGGFSVGQETLSRTCTAHTLALPAGDAAASLVHFLLIRKQGVSGPL